MAQVLTQMTQFVCTMVEELDNTFTRLINCTHVDDMKENDKNKTNLQCGVFPYL